LQATSSKVAPRNQLPGLAPVGGFCLRPQILPIRIETIPPVRGVLLFGERISGVDCVLRTEAIGLTIFLSCAICASARADSLRKTAAPMSSELVKKLYSGNTAIRKDSDIYFAPDGSIKGVFGKPQVKAFIEGSWSVTANEICMYIYKGKDPNFYRDCYQYWLDGKRIVALWSGHSDNSAVDQNDGYHFGEEKALSPGDLVSEKLSAFHS
jgi:hypothetical protein